MCELAVGDSSWLMVDSWEAVQLLLDHFDHEINHVIGGAEPPYGARAGVRVSLLAGADLVQTMSTPV
jgi:nicotinamide mononucleotide adenylyltransferase